MEFSKGQRATLILILLLGLSSLFVWGGIDRPPAPQLGIYPEAEEVAQQPSQYQNEQITIHGRVISTDPVIVRAEYEADSGLKSIDLQIADIGTDVTRGDKLQIFGTLIDAQTIRATNIVVFSEIGRWYTWLISFIAGLWVLVRIINRWTIDLRTGAFSPRSDPLYRVFDGDD